MTAGKIKRKKEIERERNGKTKRTDWKDVKRR